MIGIVKQCLASSSGSSSSSSSCRNSDTQTLHRFKEQNKKQKKTKNRTISAPNQSLLCYCNEWITSTPAHNRVLLLSSPHWPTTSAHLYNTDRQY